MALCPIATVALLPRSGTRPAIRPTQIVSHTMESTLAATDRIFRREDARGRAAGQSHFGIARDGRIVQWIDTAEQADAVYLANRRPDGTGAVSVTTEGYGSQAWTQAQLAALTKLHVWLLRTHPSIGRRICRSPVDPGIGHHVLFGSPGPWTPSTRSCPGPRRTVQWRDEVVPRVLAAFELLPDDLTSHQLADAYIAELVGETATALRSPEIAGWLKPPRTGRQMADPEAEQAARQPVAADSSTAQAGEPHRKGGQLALTRAPRDPARAAPGDPDGASGADPRGPAGPQSGSRHHPVMDAVRDFFLPDSAPRRDHCEPPRA